jgi:hypothetical protein
VTALVAHAPTRLVRTDAKVLREVSREFATNPENAAREFGAQFMTTGTGEYFDPSAIAASVDDDLPFPMPIDRGAEHFAGADLAFRGDASALAINAASGGRHTIAEIDEVRPEKGKPLVPSAVIARFAAVLARYGIKQIMIDGWHFDSVAEDFAEHGIVAVLAPSGQPGKTLTHGTVREILHGGRLRIPGRAAKLARQLREVVSRPTPGGGSVIGTARRGGSHGDVASAAVLAVYAATGAANCQIPMPENTAPRAGAEPPLPTDPAIFDTRFGCERGF